jgi:hypothetical protein
MNVGLALEIDASIDSMSDVVTELDDTVKKWFRERSYGSDVANVFIGIVLTTPASERLHPVRDLKFKKRVRFTIPKVDLENVVEFDVKPNFEIFSKLSPPQAREYLAGLIVESTEVMTRHQSKFPNFDIARFKEDLRACLRV